MLGRELVEWFDAGQSAGAMAACFAAWDRKRYPSAESGTDGRLTAMDVDDLDIADRQAVLETLGDLKPTLVINAAGYTDVDGCERHEELATRVNADGPAHLAEACGRIDCRLVHVSTDYVFDGTATRPYRPDDAVRPGSAYGRTKAAGEAAVRRHLPDRHLIVRTSWMFSAFGKNFVNTIRRLASQRDELRVVTDQVGCPTYARDLAAALLIAGRAGTTGTHHFCNAGACSWNDFAAAIVRLAGADCRVLPTTAAELNRPAPRPAYSVLSTADFTRETGVQPRDWRTALASCIAGDTGTFPLPNPLPKSTF